MEIFVASIFAAVDSLYSSLILAAMLNLRVKCWLLILNFFSFYALGSSELNSINDSRSGVLQFAYDSGRSGTVRSAFYAKNYGSLQEVLASEFTSALPLMPLMAPVPFENSTHKILYFPGARGRMHAFDLKLKKLLWHVDIEPGFEFTSTGVISQKFQRLYALAIKSDAKLPPEIRLYSFSLATGKTELKPINFQPLQKNNPTTQGLPALGSTCRSALALNENISPPRIYFGCGISPRAPLEGKARYRIPRGLRGFIASIALEKNTGEILDTVALFPTSALTSDPRTGWEAGLWNTGSGITILKDGSLLVALGNGPFFPDLGSYGCATLHLDSNLQPIKREGKTQLLSADLPNFTECQSFNLDPGASAVATLSSADKTIGAVAGKGKRLNTFIVSKDNSFSNPQEIETIEYSYGQPTLSLSQKGEPIIFFASGLMPRQNISLQLQSDISEGLAPAEFSPRNYERISCLGLLQKHGNAEDRVDLYYSGYFRNDWVALRAGSNAASWLQEDPVSSIALQFLGNYRPQRDPDLWSRYVPMMKLGYAYPKESNGSGCKLEPFSLVLNDSQGGFFIHESSKLGNNSVEKIIDKNSLHLLPCEAKCESESTVRLYRFAQKRKLWQKGFQAEAHTLDNNGKLRQLWQIQDASGMYPSRSNSASTVGYKSEAGLSFIALDNDDSGNSAKRAQAKHKSELLILETETGKIRDRIALPSPMYFSMPLLVDKFLIIATRRNGLIIYELIPGRKKKN